MKLIRFERDGRSAWGFVPAGAQDGRVLTASHADAPGFLGLLAAREAAGGSAGRPDEAGVPLASLRLLPPIVPGATLYCVGLNYKAHIDEVGREPPSAPSVFLRRPASVVASGQAMKHPGVSTRYDFEGELAVVIGKPGRHIREADALAHVGAYTCFNDGSVRDFQQQSLAAGKNFERSGACGPWLVTADEIPDPRALRLVTRLNGETVQEAGVDTLIFPVPMLISYLSQVAELQPGDLIATGTPAGVGAGRKPPLWMKPGDRIEVQVDPIGMLANTIEA